MKPAQLKIFPATALEYGGSARKGRRKVRRPFDRRRSMHIVMRSSRAKGAWSFLNPRHKLEIHGILIRLCEKYGIKIYGYENVGNHLHLHLRFPSRRELRAFLRVFAQRVMFLVTGARKGSPRGRFFEQIAYSRVVAWGREFFALKRYFLKNALESFGFSRAQIAAFGLLPRNRRARAGPG